MKYLLYVFVLLFTLFRKVFGLVWFYPAMLFRRYSRNVVHNYVLQNDIYLPRLWERPISRTDGMYKIGAYHGTNGGYIRYRKISWLEYQFAYWVLWGWVDDDSNHDTMSGGERDGMMYGNSFDLGDLRNDFPEFEFKESTKWLWRNTAYNFKYIQHECAKDSWKHFYFEFKNWHFGYIPYGQGHESEGRLVFFSKYKNKIKKKD